MLAPSIPPQVPAAPKPKRKRPSSDLMQPLKGEMSLQPHQQYQFAPINDPNNPATFQPAPFPQGEASDKAGKKRGRPSKAERELREAEAAARGEVYQPTKRKPKTPRPSAEGAAGAEGEQTPSSDKKPKKQKVVAGSIGTPGMPSMQGVTFPAAPPPGDQMQVDIPEHQPRSIIPETQISDFPASESFLVGMKEQAAQSEVPRPSAPSQFEPAESSEVLQQEQTKEQPKQPEQPQGSRPVASQPPEAQMT